MTFSRLWVEEVGHPPSNPRERKAFANAIVLFDKVPPEIVRRYIRESLGISPE